MIIVVSKNCKGCGICARECPLGAIKVEDKKAIVNEKCVQCGLCVKSCKFGAINRTDEPTQDSVKCCSCPVQCQIQEGFTGACQRYRNEGGVLVRNRALVTERIEQNLLAAVISKPLITAVGSGTNYPCCRPAPFIVQDNVAGIDVVTVVTEAPLSYSGLKVKIDTNYYIGEEGAKVLRDGRVVGMVDTEEYGSKMLSIGGANLLTGKDGVIVAKTIVELANGERVKLSVNNGAKLELQTGFRPIVNGIEDTKMRVGCGSATIGLFANLFKEVVDEAIILDHHVIGLFSEHLAGAEVGMTWSGVMPNARKSTRGRYFGEHGEGWGGTDIKNPLNAVKSVDMNIAKAGMKVLITETTGQKAALLEIQEDGSLCEIPLTQEIESVVRFIHDNCEDARVSVLYVGGTGGSARGGVTNSPLALTKAVHEGKAVLTIGGAPTYILPGGGINFMADTEKMVPKAFAWVPTPATVAPIEYTMKQDDYADIGGHIEKIVNLDQIKKR